jgi:predicted ester cyclase
MTRDDIVALFASRLDAIARRDVDLIASQHTPDCEHVSSLPGGTVKGREAIGELYKQWFKGFPDFVLASEELLIDGARVIEVTTQSGTDTGGFMELPPTGKPFRVPVVWLFTLKDNQFAHVRPIYDFTGTLLQIGVLKAKPAV